MCCGRGYEQLTTRPPTNTAPAGYLEAQFLGGTVRCHGKAAGSFARLQDDAPGQAHAVIVLVALIRYDTTCPHDIKPTYMQTYTHMYLYIYIYASLTLSLSLSIYIYIYIYVYISCHMYLAYSRKNKSVSIHIYIYIYTLLYTIIHNRCYHMVMGQNPVPAVKLQIPTKIDWVVHLAQNGTKNGFDPQPYVYTTRHICMCIYIYIHICICIYTYMYMHIYIYTYTIDTISNVLHRSPQNKLAPCCTSNPSSPKAGAWWTMQVPASNAGASGAGEDDPPQRSRIKQVSCNQTWY